MDLLVAISELGWSFIILVSNWCCSISFLPFINCFLVIICICISQFTFINWVLVIICICISYFTFIYCFLVTICITIRICTFNFTLIGTLMHITVSLHLISWSRWT
ncbi:unnamed protein product [Meganyctiphanes norvegica]|uniref:NADH dehydrogenase subunit 6 n=1 Tax=Meganyctiphanes norvegica TaxID=48144 RepID=A0AAV2SNM6_MEGNR